MSAAPAVVHQPERPHVVRLRVRTHAWTSGAMTLAEADDLAADLSRRIEDIGDTWRLIPFAGRDGKTFTIRAREILAVEVAPEGVDQHRPDRDRDRSRPASPLAAAGIVMTGGPAATGTTFLQQQAARQHAGTLDTRRHR